MVEVSSLPGKRIIWVRQAETMKYNFERYTTRHRSCHNQINVANAAMNPPQPEIPERTKVINFLNGIQAPSLVAVIATVRDTPWLKSNFELCADYFSTFITQCNKDVRDVATLQIEQGGGDRGCKTGGGRSYFFF